MSRLRFHMEWLHDLHIDADDEFQVQYQEITLYESDDYTKEWWFMDELCTAWESLSLIETIIEDQGVKIIDTLYDEEHADIGDEND